MTESKINMLLSVLSVEIYMFGALAGDGDRFLIETATIALAVAPSCIKTKFILYKFLNS